VYQEAKEEVRAEGREEGKLTAILPMLALGATPEQIASALELEIDKVRQIQQQSQSQQNN
jgi:predicted transposase YdaD